MSDVFSPQDEYNEWLARRIGLVTSSNLWKAVFVRKDGAPKAERRTYMLQLIAEKLTGQPTEYFMSGPMQWGIETEPQARAAYEARTGNVVEKVTGGFVEHPVIPNSGCSPDGLVNDDGLIEIKCPNTSTHLATILEGVAIDEKYVLQMQWQMACQPERKFCDFVSFDPRLPLSSQMFIRRIRRDEKLIKGLETRVIEFLNEMRQAMEVIEGAAHLESSHV